MFSRKNSFLKKIVYSFLLIGLIFTNSIGTAQALFGGGPSVPSVEEVMDKVEKQYGFDSNILRRSMKKADYPQADVFFDNTSPKTGEKVTATAMPKFFKNSNENLYYTWFLFREGEDDIEEAKQLAMGMVARGDFDPNLFGTDYRVSGDDDGYDASYGGGDGRGGRDVSYSGGNNGFESSHYVTPTSKQVVNTNAISRCYRHNFGFSNPSDYGSSESSKAGEDLIVECEHKFSETPNKNEEMKNPKDGDLIKCDSGHEVGDGDFGKNEELCWQLDPTNPDTDGDGFVDEADLAGLGQTQLTWTFQKGDRVGVIIEGTSMIAINETNTAISTLSPIISYTCVGKSDGTICLNSSYEIGECISGTCTSNPCTESSSDGKPCELGAGGTGMCDYNPLTGIGTCEAVSDCAISSAGNLCEKDGIEGVCLSSECIKSRCGSSGDKCQTDMGTVGICDSLGICRENTSSFSDTGMNPYYKIMWAGLDICDKEQVEGDDKRLLVKNDECEGTNDYGYTYLATKRVSEASADLLKTTLNFSPEEPQADKENPEYSDFITVKANFIESDIKDDFVYYEWDIYKCTESQIINDTCTESGEKLTNGCAGVLGDCSGLDSSSLIEGMGEKEIKFRGSSSLYNTAFFNSADKMYFKVALTTKENKNADKKYISSVNIPINKNDLEITFYGIDFKDSSSTSSLSSSICIDGDPSGYKELCPVYTGQFLVASYDGDDDKIQSAYWELNDEKISFPTADPFPSALFSGLDYYIYFPITGSGANLHKISFKALTDDGETITSERIISTEKPMIKKIKPNNTSVWAQTFEDSEGTEISSENVLRGKIGETISLKAETVPKYLEGSLSDNNIEVKWYLNSQEIDADFRTANPGYGISFPEERVIEFLLGGGDGDSFNLKAEITKSFNDAEKTFLEDNWGIKNSKSLTTNKTVTIRQTNDDNPGGALLPFNDNSLNLFMASTFKNAPEYLIFIVKTAIILVLFWSLAYGFNYWFGREFKLEE